ncbi:MAG: translation initiation factor IF-2 [Parachlamydiaceae bacterium]
MAKNLKLNIKNEQIAQAINLSGLKNKLADKKASSEKVPPAEVDVPTEKIKGKLPSAKPSTKPQKAETAKIESIKSDFSDTKEIKEEAPKIRARSRSAFAEPTEVKTISPVEETAITETVEQEFEVTLVTSALPEDSTTQEGAHRKSSEQLRREIFGEEVEVKTEHHTPHPFPSPFQNEPQTTEIAKTKEPLLSPLPAPLQTTKPTPAPLAVKPLREFSMSTPSKGSILKPTAPPVREFTTPQPRLGPTGRHVNDLVPPRRPDKPAAPAAKPAEAPAVPRPPKGTEDESEAAKNRGRIKSKVREGTDVVAPTEEKKGVKAKFKEFKDIKPAKRTEQGRFDGRDRLGLRSGEEEEHWRKRRVKGSRYVPEDVTIRPTNLAIRIPIAIKDLAAEMKLKASQLVARLFSQGVIATLNDLLEDETTIQLLGHEFGCDITIDTKEERRIKITDKSIKEEINESEKATQTIRPPVVTFMGHVDHGKTSLIDAIRKSNRVSGEAGAITQHIGAFRCSTPVGDIAILDTPGHEAFSSMRARGAEVTDIVVLVIAGDEGMRQQTIEALQHAKAAKVTIVVAINKCDKPNFNVETVYRQLAEQELLPEAWGGQTITINCSAVTGEGIPQLLEMLALQAEILELRANPNARARGTVLESEMHKGMGPIATVLVQNGTLRCGDSLVFGQLWGRVKTMRNEFLKDLQEAGPSTPVEITGMSGLPEAGQEFVVVKNEKEARDIAEARMLGMRQVNLLQAKKISMENLLQQASETNKKILNIVLRADVQGSLEALKVALMKIESQKAELNIIFTGVGEVSESDVQLAAASKAVIIGFHTQIESHAEALLKQLGVQVRLHNIIYHAIDDVKDLMGGMLDKIAQEADKGKAEVKATFKSSQHGIIAGCIVTEGTIARNNFIRLKRNKEIIWKGNVGSLKRVKEDVREVSKGIECGILLNGFNELLEGDILEAYEITYITQEL